MRLVSVVVPDCEIATTIVSRMSAASSKPESSVAVSASTAIGRVAERLAEHAREALPGDVRAALTDHEHPAHRTRLRAARGSRGVNVSAGSRTSSRPSRSTMRPRSVLRNESGASAISLSR